MPELNIEDLLPMPPMMGPPLPRYLGIYWPWYKPEEIPPEEEVTPPPEVAEFAYVSNIKREYYSEASDCFMVDVRNVSNIAGICSLEFYTRVKQRVPVGWTDWQLMTVVSHTLQPGEIRTFGDNKECLMRAYFMNNVVRMSVKFVGEPGVIIWEHRAWA